MDLSFRGKTPTGEFVTGNGYYGDSKKAWIVNVVPTSYGRDIHKHEVEPESITYYDNEQKKSLTQEEISEMVEKEG